MSAIAGVPTRIVFIRHAEKHGEPGVDSDGTSDPHSLTIRGWQRAGALARLFVPVTTGRRELKPDAIFASHIGEGSETRRPQETLAPLHALLPDTPFDTRHLKSEVDDLMDAVLERRGTVLVAWEHSMLPDCVARLPGIDAPEQWPAERYDLLWICDRTNEGGWSFSQRGQRLLAGDA